MASEYVIANEEDAAALAELVNRLLAAGWSLHGGVSVTAWHARTNPRKGYEEHETFFLYAQALVRNN